MCHSFGNIICEVCHSFGNIICEVCHSFGNIICEVCHLCVLYVCVHICMQTKNNYALYLINDKRTLYVTIKCTYYTKYGLPAQHAGELHDRFGIDHIKNKSAAQIAAEHTIALIIWCHICHDPDGTWWGMIPGYLAWGRDS